MPTVTLPSGRTPYMADWTRSASNPHPHVHRLDGPRAPAIEFHHFAAAHPS